MPAFYKKKQFWGSIIAIILLVYCVKDISISQINVLYKSVSFYYLIPAMIFSFAMIISKAIRWRTIIEKTKKISQEINRFIFYPVKEILSPLYKIEFAPSGKVMKLVPEKKEKKKIESTEEKSSTEDVYREEIK